MRTLHYYDEIDLLKPSILSEAGYRLYDDKALETLQQILFFKELDLPLKQIKIILKDPGLDKKQLLSSQKRMLELKKERLERIITSIGDILKGDNKMDFGVFSKTEIARMYDDMERNMTDEQKEIFIKEYGSMERYGSKDKVKEVATNPDNAKNAEEFGKKLDQAIKKLAAKVGVDVNAPLCLLDEHCWFSINRQSKNLL